MLLCRQILGGKKPSEASADKKGEKIDPLQNLVLSISLSGLSFHFQRSVLILFLLTALPLFLSLSCSAFLTLSHMQSMEYDPRSFFFLFSEHTHCANLISFTLAFISPAGCWSFMRNFRPHCFCVQTSKSVKRIPNEMQENEPQEIAFYIYI